MSSNAYGAPGAQIHDLCQKLRREIGSIAAARTPGVPFPVRGAKDLNQKLAEALDRLNMLAPVIDQQITFVDCANIPDNKNARGNVIFRTLVHVKATVRLIAPDGSYLDMVGSGHGGDTDDKAGGKASTYAWKDAILKGLSIPHEDMVDTDDDAPTVGKSGPPPAAKPQPAPSAPAVSSADVFADIAAAKSVADLEPIKAAVAAGKYQGLVGADRLRASKAWVERKSALEKGG